MLGPFVVVSPAVADVVARFRPQRIGASLELHGRGGFAVRDALPGHLPRGDVHLEQLRGRGHDHRPGGSRRLLEDPARKAVIRHGVPVDGQGGAVQHHDLVPHHRQLGGVREPSLQFPSLCPGHRLVPRTRDGVQLPVRGQHVPGAFDADSDPWRVQALQERVRGEAEARGPPGVGGPHPSLALVREEHLVAAVCRQHTGHPGLTQKGEGGHVHGMHGVRTAHQNVARGLGHPEGTAGRAERAIYGLGFVVEVPHQPLGLVGHPDATVVQVDVGGRNPPVNQREDTEGERDETDQYGLDTFARDQGHASFFLRSPRQVFSPGTPRPINLPVRARTDWNTKGSPGPVSKPGGVRTCTRVAHTNITRSQARLFFLSHVYICSPGEGDPCTRSSF